MVDLRAASKPEAMTQRAGGFRLALLGAGRLGQAIAKVWFARTGEAPLVWSRGGRQPPGNAGKRIAAGVWVSGWDEALQARSLVVALPGRALLDLARDSERARAFEGNVFSAAASLSQDSLQRAFPRATAVCIAPFLLAESNSVPVVALRPPALPESGWEGALAELRVLGAVDVVQDEDLFARLFLLGAAWPVVAMAAIQAAAAIGTRGLRDETAIGMARSLFLRGLLSLLSTQAADGPEEQSAGEAVATPGGITERGLDKIGELTSVLESAFDQMRARANELRA